MREDQGGVYGVSVSGSASRYPKPMFTIQSTFGCSPENITKLTGTMINEMEKIKKDGPTEIDLNKVKETLIRDRETRMKENGFWLTLLQNHYLLGDNILTLDEYKVFINSITTTDIKAIAEMYLNTKNYVQVALTPSASPAAK